MGGIAVGIGEGRADGEGDTCIGFCDDVRAGVTAIVTNAIPGKTCGDEYSFSGVDVGNNWAIYIDMELCRAGTRDNVP